MLRPDFDSFKEIKNPSPDDFKKLITFTESVMNLLYKERKARSALNKKNRKLAARLAE